MAEHDSIRAAAAGDRRFFSWTAGTQPELEFVGVGPRIKRTPRALRIRERELPFLRRRDEVARHYGVSLRTVAVWLREGMPGTLGYFPVREIENWLARRR